MVRMSHWAIFLGFMYAMLPSTGSLWLLGNQAFGEPLRSLTIYLIVWPVSRASALLPLGFADLMASEHSLQAIFTITVYFALGCLEGCILALIVALPEVLWSLMKRATAGN